MNDFARYQVLGSLMRQEKFTGPKFMEYWREREQIKNRHGGMPPENPAKIIVDGELKLSDNLNHQSNV
jgi:hypothetical protein